jgi:FkbM family methyltransferase
MKLTMKMNIYPSKYTEIFEKYPLTLVDVGASGGIASQWKRHRLYLRVIGFEPDPRAFENLSSQNLPQTQFFKVALHSLSGTVPFYLTRKQETSSCFLPNRDFLDRFHKPNRFDVINETTLTCEPLDKLLHKSGTRDVDFIKSDTQGAELDILTGASSLLAETVFGLELEVAFAPIYEKSPLFADIDIFLRKFGFSLIDLRTVSWKRTVGKKVGNPKGQLVYADALYFREPIRFQALLNNLESEAARSKLLRAFCVCQIYGYLDYALELIDLIGDTHFSHEEIRQLHLHIQSQAPLISRIPNFPGRNNLYRILMTLTKWIQPRSHRLKQRKLGNL